MKKRVYRKTNNGFTLVELLAVIGIIALLASILLPVINTTYQKVEKARALTEIKSLETAIKLFHAEYGRFPLDNGGSDRAYGSDADNKDLIFTLRAISGENNNNHTNNPRRIVFLESESRNMENDNYIDPWDSQYQIVMDTDFNNICKVNISNQTTTVQSREVVVISFGPDGLWSNNVEGSDDIVSW